MLLPNNIRPEDCIYFNGANVLEIMQREKKMSITDLYCKMKEISQISFATLMLCLDWLYLINCVILNNNGEVVLCS